MSCKLALAHRFFGCLFVPLNMTVIESIVRELRELPPPQLVEVARYVHGLNPKSHERRRAALLATAGCMPGEEGEDFERAVKAEADRINGDAW